MPGRSLIRIAINVALDGGLAALAVPVAWWIADPRFATSAPAWLPAAGAGSLLLAGLPFRLSLQYWRFAGLSELLGVAGASGLSAALFAGILAATGTEF